MSSAGGGLQVKKVLKKIVDEVVKEFEEHDKLLAQGDQASNAEQQVADSEGRRPVRARKEPERLASNPAEKSKQSKRERTKKEDPFKCEIVMDPAPADLRGILKPARKSSLSAKAGKSISNKYRKVRVSRKLQYKVIPPLPGWRADRTRMPEDDPDEEEQQRLEEEQAKEREAQVQSKRRKRKSIGATLPSTSEDDTTAGGDEISGVSDLLDTPASPDVFYEEYMKAGSPDSVLTTDNESDERREERRKAVPNLLFPRIDEQPNEGQGEDTVAGNKEDTVAKEEPPIDTKKRTERRRSVRIQERDEKRRTMLLTAEANKEMQKRNEPPEEEKSKTAAAEKKDRRKSKIFPVTPVKESPAAKEKKPVEKSVRRRSGVTRAPAGKDEASTARNPWNDDPCRSEEEKAAASAANAERKSKKVMAWLTRSEADLLSTVSVLSGVGEVAGDEIPDAAEQRKAGPDEIESVRGSDSREGQFSDKSSASGTMLVEAKSEQAKRKGRRSMKMTREDIVSKSKSEESDKKKQHPFFAQFAPKPSPVVEHPAPAATVPAEKKQVRRRSMFAPKKPLAGKKESSSPVEKKKDADDEDVIEIVEEIKKEKKEGKEEPGDRDVSQPASASIWRSTEIDAAPYAGLVHVGRDETVEEEEAEGEVVVKKMRRLSVRLPRISSYAVPSSLREKEEPEPAEMIPVFDETRAEGQSDRAAALAERAAAAQLAADPSVVWPEAMRPRKVEECIGDQEVLASGKRWLQKWKKRLEKAAAEEEKATKAPKAKKRKRRGGNYSDESEQEDSDPDYDNHHEEHRLPNPLVLSGPIGCGKTAYIRALSEEVGFSLLESSPDESRSGSSLRAKLAEAVRSHRMSSKPAGALTAFFAAKSGGEEKKREGKHTLVVIEHIDVIFAEHDKLFWPALAEILATTRIPIVLTCNVVPDELSKIFKHDGDDEETKGPVPMEIAMCRGGGATTVEEYVEASIAGSSYCALSATVIPAIAARARQDLRAALYDAHWAAAGSVLNQSDLVDRRMRRVDEPSVCDTVARQSWAWRDECVRRTEVTSTSELSRVAEWPARGRMPGQEYIRLCKQIDEIDQDAYREADERADRMIEMARDGVQAGNDKRARLLTRREIAMDWMPILEQIDRKEREKKKESRRHLHYFNVVKPNTGAPIDPSDQIQRSCAFFRLPTDLQ